MSLDLDVCQVFFPWHKVEANTISQPLMANRSNLRVYTGTFIAMTVTNHPSTWQNAWSLPWFGWVSQWSSLPQSPGILCGFLWSQAKEPNDTAAEEDRKDHNASSWAIQLTNMNQTCLPPKGLGWKEHVFETTTKSLRDSCCFQCRYSNAQHIGRCMLENHSYNINRKKCKQLTDSKNLCITCLPECDMCIYLYI